jgi:hypothetical protein
MRFIILLSLLAACGGKAPEREWAGSWRTTPAPPGSYVQMTLSGSGTAIAGSGTQYREAGTPTSFTVSGDLGAVPAGGVKFSYADNSTELPLLPARPEPPHAGQLSADPELQPPVVI